MKQIKHLTKDIKSKILNFLYEEEIMNVFLISLITNDLIDQLYIEEKQNEIASLLHLKYDGNSYFTNFFAKNNEHLKTIALKLKNLEFSNVLLAGKLKDVEMIFNFLNSKNEIQPNIYYQFEESLFNRDNLLLKSLKKATIDDIPTIKPFLIDFFSANTKEEKDDITNPTKLKEDLKHGMYLYHIDGQTIGMARFSGSSKHYCDITTVYIDPKYRKQGHGLRLMKCMIMKALEMKKNPVTQTANNNIPARRTYESLGFVPIDDYAFEFIGMI